MPQLVIHQFPCLKDNYGVLVHEPVSGLTAAIDAPCAGRVRQELDEKGWNLSHILTTHHHADHTGGHLALKQETGCIIVGPAAEAARIPGIDVEVGEGGAVEFGAYRIRVLKHRGIRWVT